MKKIISIFATLSSVMLLSSACSDDSSSTAASMITNSSCTVFESGSSAYTIQCPDGTSVTIHDGTNGKDGENGINGTDGKDGANGENGKDGADGINGTDGKDGADGENGTSTSLPDTLNAKTSCTIKDNEDKTYTIICPDGTSATISNNAAVVGGPGEIAPMQSTSLTEYSYSNSFTSKKSFYVYDYQKYLHGRKDSVKVHVYSESDTAGIITYGYPSPFVTSYYMVDFYVTPGKTHDNTVHASAGDTIFIVYLSGHDLATDTICRVWSPKAISNNATLSFSQNKLFGDSAKVNVSLTDSDLTADTITLQMNMNQKSSTVKLIGGEGYYSAQLTFVTTPTASGDFNVFTVKEPTTLAMSYTDVSSGKTISDTANWLYTVKGNVQFDNDYHNFSGSTTITIYLFDDDRTSSTATVWVRNERNKDSIEVTLNKYTNDYFYGNFSVSQTQSSGLWVPDTSYITVSYYDPSVNEIVTEQSLVRPYESASENITFRFRDTLYAGISDKATLYFYNSDMKSGSNLTFTITSTSDPTGFSLQSAHYSSSILDNGSVGFTTGTTKDGLIHVETGDTVYATYISPLGKKYVAKTVWLPGLQLDTENYIKNKSCTTSEETLFTGLYDTSAKYVCQNGSFRKATDREIQVDAACISSNIGETYQSTFSDYVCTSSGFQIAYGILEDTRDGKTYKTVRIGLQTWMAENLNYDGEDYSAISSYNWCYDNDVDNCNKYGRLYTWTAAMNISNSYSTSKYSPSTTTTRKAICPTGSHLPTLAEWKTLLSNTTVENLTTGQWYSSYKHNNTTGFNLIGSGYKSSSTYGHLDQTAYFWTVDEYSSTSAYTYYFTYSNSAGSTSDSKNYAYAVRCVID